ncbi:ricin-type beta-trefoil lectin domain protein [Reichenbachiella agarivorans]|uniref:Ricin-type beta-trefoil lectin domain protein n=1 Tax=Reichenbachiella agarivorans TaxID=2979464 RepID=A0ABY6CQ56_9BACT|nr:RICIN domain-containing protein [Reichenbachiella agarivorans]UXP32637.1 ricin-type beta-trefoil lectin domain protein [Reichenbachiella agarivorans]
MKTKITISQTWLWCMKATVCLMFFGLVSHAQTTVYSLSALKPYLDDNNANVKLAPGTYSVTAADVANGLYSDQSDVVGRISKVLFLFEGNNSTYDFTGVTINVSTAVFQSFGNYNVYEMQIIGNNNVLKNLTLVDNGSVNDNPSKSACNLVMDGSGNRIEGFHVTVKGSYPYGYGDAFGKGGGPVISHRKHSACLIRGESNHVKNCTFIHRSYGHAIFMQAASNPTVEGCNVEGEMRTTDDMLDEEGTGSPADNVDFMTVWGYKLPAGYMMSLGEGGIRAYNAGETVINGVGYERGTSNPTVLNCTVKYMRTGVTLAHATGTKYVEGCTIIGCEQGYAIGSGNVVNCRADAAFGPVYQSTYDNDNGFHADITIIPAVDAYYNGSKSVAYIGSDYSNVTLRSSEATVNQNLKIQMGGDHKNIRFLNGSNASQNNHSGYHVDIENFTNYPIVIASGTNYITGESCGTVTNSGSNNSISSSSNCPSFGGDFQLVKRNATNYAIDGGVGAVVGRSVELYTYVQHANLTWTEIDRGGGYYSYQKLNTTVCLDGGSGGSNGQDVTLKTCSSSNYAQQWQKIDAGNGHYRLQKRGTNFSIDGGNGGAINQNVYLWASSSTNQNQQWRFDNVSSARVVSQETVDPSILTNELTIYPNPAMETFKILVKDKGFSSYMLFDVRGGMLQRDVFDPAVEELAIDVKQYSAGIYLLKLEGANDSKTLRLVKE